jgi:hypothetical protein
MLTRAFVVLAFALSLSCGNKDAGGTASGNPPAAAAPAPLAPGISQDLKHNSEAPFYVFDSLGPVNYPAIQKGIQVSGDTDIGVSGWALDVSKKGEAGGVDVVLDNVPHSARYGVPRSDVASHFNRPDYTNSGFLLTLARGQVSKGPHTLSVRVIAGDKKSYNEGPVIQFTVN